VRSLPPLLHPVAALRHLSGFDVGGGCVDESRQTELRARGVECRAELGQLPAFTFTATKIPCSRESTHGRRRKDSNPYPWSPKFFSGVRQVLQEDKIMADKVKSPWELARVKKAEAYSIAGHLVLIVSGDKPTPCYRVRIEHVLTIKPPPTFIVEWREFGTACPDVVTLYRQAATFNIGSTPDKIDVVTADGTMSVKVQHLPLKREGAAAAKKAPVGVATGYSSTFSFEEAFENAIEQLPPQFPDELQQFVVTETGALIGGIAGLRVLYVTVQV